MAEPTREQYEKKLEKLQKRAEHLEQSISDLPDDADEGDITWFSDELRKTQAQIRSFENKLQDIEVEEEATRLKQAADEHSDLVKIYRQAQRERRLHEMPKPLLDRCLKAVQQEGAERLAASNR